MTKSDGETRCNSGESKGAVRAAMAGRGGAAAGLKYAENIHTVQLQDSQ